MKKPNSITGYWVREQGTTNWEDASDLVKYAYGRFYDEEDVATAYINYRHERDEKIMELYVEVLNNENKVYSYRAYVVPSFSYYADKEDSESDEYMLEL